MEFMSVEEENCVRMNLLLLGIARRAVRTFFDREFDPACLDASLKKEYNKLHDLKKKHRINQSQWNLLFPRFPDVPDSRTFDVNLMILLLRHLNVITPPLSGFDSLPSAKDVTPAADLARIKHYRNQQSHLDDDKRDPGFFNTAWNDITNAIDRLGGQQMKQECDQLKTKPLDQTNQEIMMEIKHLNNEILNESIKNVIKSHQLLREDHAEVQKSHQLLREDHAEVQKSHELLQDTSIHSLRVRDRHRLLERISIPTEFKALLSKGTYASYENRVYLAGSVKTGKSTLANVLIGEQIPTNWKSTDGLIIHFGKNGIDLKERKMIPLKRGGEGHDVFAKLLLGNVELKYSGTQTKLPSDETEGMHTEEITVLDTANLELSIKEDMRNEILQGNYKMNIAPSDLVDFGGQKSYDMTHQLFIQCKGTFVLMFDGRFSLYDALEEYKPNEITTMSILIHWIDSILTYCVDESIEEHKLPKIVFAATHGDFYTQDELNKRKAIFIDELTKTFSSNDLHEHIIYQTVFFFDARNEHDSELQKLTEHLVDIAFAQPSWGQQMPVAWVPLELQISKMKTARMNFVRKSELQKINTQNGDLALSNSQFDHFLKVQHSLGKLMYFGDHGIDNFIVIQPSAFVNVLRSFVTDEMFWPKDEEVINILPILSKTGVLLRNGLYKLWEQKHFEQLVPTDDLKKYIIDVLIHLDILVEPKRYRGAEKSAEFFLVPCMIKEKAPTAFLNLEEMADKMICMSYRLKRSSVPAALIFKLIGSALNVLPIKETDGRPCLYYQAATFSIDDNNECRMHMKGSRIVVNLINKVSRLEISPDIAASIQECLTLTLTNVLHFYYACMGNDIKKVDISKLFESEVGVLCGKELCFIPVDEAMKRKTWTCEKEKIHETQLHWILDENIGQDECRPGCDGISAEDLCRIPNDKHLVGLASELNIKNFHEFILHLGLKTKDWDQIGYNWGRAEDAKVVALLQWKERNEIVTFEKLLDAQAYIGDNQHHLCKVFKGQTGLLDNTSFKYPDTPEDIFLSTLSRKLGNCVIQLGIELGLTFSDIEAVYVKHPKDLFSQMYEVLKIWKQKTPENTYHNLMIAIQRVKGKQFIKRNFCCNM